MPANPSSAPSGPDVARQIVGQLKPHIEGWCDCPHGIGICQGAHDLLARALADARREGEWQPIESADKEGDTIIVYAPGYQKPVIAAVWDDDVEAEGGQCWRAADCYGDRLVPTHWIEWPNPPGQRAAQEAPK